MWLIAGSIALTFAGRLQMMEGAAGQADGDWLPILLTIAMSLAGMACYQRAYRSVADQLTSGRPSPDRQASRPSPNSRTKAAADTDAAR
jgi:hypothetical protein